MRGGRKKFVSLLLHLVQLCLAFVGKLCLMLLQAFDNSSSAGVYILAELRNIIRARAGRILCLHACPHEHDRPNQKDAQPDDANPATIQSRIFLYYFSPSLLQVFLFCYENSIRQRKVEGRKRAGSADKSSRLEKRESRRYTLPVSNCQYIRDMRR